MLSNVNSVWDQRTGTGRLSRLERGFLGNSFQVTFVNYFFLDFILSNELEELVVGVL